MADVFNHVECPNCFVEWTADEISNQSCDECGWPQRKEREPDMMGPNAAETAEQMWNIQRNIK